MSDVTIAAVTLADLNLTQLTNVTGSCTVQNGDATVIFSTPLPARYARRHGHQIQLGSVIYRIAYTAEDRLSVELTTNYASTSGSVAFTLFSAIDLCFTVDPTFTPAGDTVPIPGSVVGSKEWYRRYTCSVRPDPDNDNRVSLFVPPTVLAATTNLANPAEQHARYFPRLYKLGEGAGLGSALQTLFIGLQSFRLDINSDTWAKIRQFNLPGTTTRNASTTFTDQQILALVGSAGLFDGDPDYIPLFKDPVTGLENSILSQSGTTVSAAGAVTATGYLAGKTYDNGGYAFNVNHPSYSAVGDAASGYNFTITASSVDFTLTTGTLATSDVGKLVCINRPDGFMFTGTIATRAISGTAGTFAVAPTYSGAGQGGYIGTNNDTAFGLAKTAAAAVGSGILQLGPGKYLLSTEFQLAVNMQIWGAGQGVTEIWSPESRYGYAAIASDHTSNAITTAGNKLQNLSIVALDSVGMGACFRDNAGAHIKLTMCTFSGGRWGVVLDQTQESDITFCRIVPVAVDFTGKHFGKVDPAANGWTKTGSGTTGTDSGKWLINTTGSNATTFYSRSLGSHTFRAGGTVKGFFGSQTAADNGSTPDNSRLMRWDNGSTYRHDLQHTDATLTLNGGTPRAISTGVPYRLEVARGGATSTLYINGTAVDTAVAALATNGSAIFGFGDFATNDDAQYYWADFEYHSSHKIGAGLWIVNGDSYKAGNSSGFTNRIAVNYCSFDGTAIHIADDGGTGHNFSHNNYNGGIYQVRLNGVINCTISDGQFEGQQYEQVTVVSTQLQGSAISSSNYGVKLEKNTFNGASNSGYKPVRLDLADTVTLDTNVYTIVAGLGACVEVDRGGVGIIHAPNESLASGADSLFDTAVAYALTSNVNDMPIGPHDVAYFTTSASYSITGFSGGRDRRRVIVVNSGSNDLTLPHQSASSAVANRVITTTTGSVVISAGGAAEIVYDKAASRWRAYLLY